MLEVTHKRKVLTAKNFLFNCNCSWK